LRNRRAQFYIISCITIIFSLLIADEILREHKPLNKEAFSSFPLSFFKNSVNQAKNMVKFICDPEINTNRQNELCEEILNKKLSELDYFLKITARDMGFSWRGRITYASPYSWHEATQYRIPIEVESNYDTDNHHVRTSVNLPLTVDLNKQLSLKNRTGDVPKNFFYNITCVRKNQVCFIDKYLQGCPVIGTDIYDTIIKNECEIEDSYMVNIEFDTGPLRRFKPVTFYLYFDTEVKG